MAQITDLKKRINSVSEIRQMTRAMQLISAVKMRRARGLLEKVMPFFALCAETMVELRDAGVILDDKFFTVNQKKKGETWRISYFILTGDQGLAGAYNLNVLATTENHIRGKIIDNTRKGLKTDVKLYVAGSIGRERLIKAGFDVDENFQYPISEPTYYRARDISDFIYGMYAKNEVDLVYFIYTHIQSAVVMEPRVTRILPVNADVLETLVPPQFKQRSIADASTILYEPSAHEVMNYLIDTYLNAMVYGMLSEAYASEQTARMMAMDHATDNADEMLGKLRLQRNQARQARITNELSEIVGGAEVLASEDEQKK